MFCQGEPGPGQQSPGYQTTLGQKEKIGDNLEKLTRPGLIGKHGHGFCSVERKCLVSGESSLETIHLIGKKQDAL